MTGTGHFFMNEAHAWGLRHEKADSPQARRSLKFIGVCWRIRLLPRRRIRQPPGNQETIDEAARVHGQLETSR
jgi:hypothetical protein